MTFAAGTRLGPYEIVAPLGAGGMGEVYKARDTRLDRVVAIKVLPTHLSEDPVRRQRFEAEARAISKLSHPHICTLYDIGRDGSIDFLVMEYMEGETLADRLMKGPLPPDQVLRHATDLASALDKAHRQGIVHRDLKPGNIMLTRSGAKLLDFGLAKSSSSLVAMLPDLSATPTQNLALTAEGTIVGTVQYMAPEQLEAKEADARTDIFAFGAVIYEMATGRKAFSGTSQASLISAIMKEEPAPISQTQPMAPPALDHIVKICLAKDPNERWQNAYDLMRDLKWIAETGALTGGPEPGTARRRTRERAWMLLALVLALATIALTVGRFSGGGAREEGAIRASILPPEKSTFSFGSLNSGPVAISRDGRLLTFVARTPDGRALLWVQPLDAVSARPMAGTEGASFPFWSPDSRSIGFFADSKLKRIDVQGGPPRTLCEASIGRGGSWSEDGTIVFAPDVNDAINRIPASGGEPAPVTLPDETRQQFNHRWPWFLPGGRQFLFFARSSLDEATGIYVASLDSGKQKFIMASRSNAIYAPPGYLLFVRENTLMAQPFDAGRLEITGDAIPIANPVSVNIAVQRAIVSVSSSGVLAYKGGVLTNDTRLEWFDRSGQSGGVVGDPATRIMARLSPDGQRLVDQITDPQMNSDLWIYDFSRGAKTRFTFDPHIETYPVWSPDGTRIVYASNRAGPFQMFMKATSGVGPEEALIHEPDVSARPCSWSSDGKYIAYARRQRKGLTRGDIWILPFFGERKPFPFLQSEFEEAIPSFSPDGRFMAYVSNESGRNEVYLTPFPGADGKWQVSTAGGTGPVWRSDGRELFYLAPDNKLMSAEIEPRDSRLEIGSARPLFQTRAVAISGTFDVSADGKRFLVVTEGESPNSEPITLVVNWAAGLGR